MGLYDGVRLAQTPYMSKYVGSIVPELADYSKTVQAKYNAAADSDDALTEALGNLQHLNLDQDTQYANELKQNYYQKLVDRSDRGDFENMGRRTRRDAVQFSQQYQPLIQRQKDFSEIVKKVNSDANIADPQKKQQILAYIQHLNSTKRDANGDFERDAAGRVNLNAIQDWAYAKDVDINKKLSDLLSKKETDIRQSGFSSDGAGLKISSVQELRSPEVIAKLAREMMATDPEIKAMLNRDVTLQNYNLSADDVRSQLKQVDKSPYQLAKSRGLNDSQIALYAKSQGVSVGDLKTSNLVRQKQAYMEQGLSAEAAERAVYNKLTEQQMMAPHIDLVANLLAVDRRKLEAREDGMFLLNAKHRMDAADKREIDNGQFQILTTPFQEANEIDPKKVTSDFSARQKITNDLGHNTNAVVLAALKRAGMSTGDPKKDVALAAEYTNNKLKMNGLKDKLRGKDPDLAGRLEVTQNQYLSAKDELGYHEANTKMLEQASNVDFNKLYKVYRDRPTHSLRDNDEKLSKDQFINILRDGNAPQRGFISKNVSNAVGLNEAMLQYDKALGKGAELVRTKKTQLNSFNPIQPTTPGYLKNASDFVQDNTKNGLIRLRVLGEGNDKIQSMADILGIKASKLNDPKSDDFQKMKNASVYINRNSINGKRTVTITQPDGSTKVAIIESGVDQKMFGEIDSRLINQAMMNRNSEMARSQAADVLLGAAESTIHTTANELKGLQPSSVKYPINDKYEVKVKPGGPEGKQYELYIRGGGLVTKAASVEDLLTPIGVDRIRETAPQK